MPKMVLLLVFALTAYPAFGAGKVTTLPQCTPENQGRSDEVVCVTNEGGCLPEDVEINGMCMNRSFMDFLCGYLDCGAGPGPGGDGQDDDLPPGGGDVADLPKPTKEQCQQAFQQCQEDTLKEGLAQCEIDQGRSAAILAFQGRTCIGDPSDIWEDLFVDSGISIGNVPVLAGCSESDFGGVSPRQQLCTGAFILEATSQCANGRDESSDPSIPFSVNFPVPGFPNIGIGLGSGSVTVTRRGGAGYQEICSDAAMAFVTTECGKLRQACEVESESGGEAQITRPPRTIEELTARIDRESLGLIPAGIRGGAVAGNITSAFRSLSQGRSEMEQSYRLRLDFLGDWSEFIKRTAMGAGLQRRVELAMQNAQGDYANVSDDWIALLIGIWLPDPKTRRMGSPDIHEEFMMFERQDDFSRRTTRAERSLFLNIRSTFGDDFLRSFRENVWPGIDRFGIASPMRPIVKLTPE
jgi:hypothetical protein